MTTHPNEAATKSTNGVSGCFCQSSTHSSERHEVASSLVSSSHLKKPPATTECFGSSLNLSSSLIMRSSIMFGPSHRQKRRVNPSAKRSPHSGRKLPPPSLHHRQQQRYRMTNPNREPQVSHSQQLSFPKVTLVPRSAPAPPPSKQRQRAVTPDCEFLSAPSHGPPVQLQLPSLSPMKLEPASSISFQPSDSSISFQSDQAIEKPREQATTPVTGTDDELDILISPTELQFKCSVRSHGPWVPSSPKKKQVITKPVLQPKRRNATFKSPSPPRERMTLRRSGRNTNNIYRTRLATTPPKTPRSNANPPAILRRSSSTSSSMLTDEIDADDLALLESALQMSRQNSQVLAAPSPNSQVIAPPALRRLLTLPHQKPASCQQDIVGEILDDDFVTPEEAMRLTTVSGSLSGVQFSG